METTLTLLCHVEQLDHPVDDARLYFGFNLSVALTADSVISGSVPEDQLRWLRPWEWQIVNFRAYALSVNGTATLLEDGVEQLSAPTMDPAKAQLLKARLTDQQSQLLKHGSKVLQYSAEPEQNADEPPWYVAQAQVSTLAAPLPQNCNLSFILAIPKALLEGRTELIAAPCVRLPGQSGTFGPLREPLEPVGPAQPLFRNAEPLGHSLAYNHPDSAELPMSTRQNQCDIDFKQNRGGWVLQSRKEFFGEDWTAALEERAASAFDLAGHLYRLTKEKYQTVGVSSGFVRAFIVVLRDLAGLGCHQVPDGSYIARTLLTRVLGDGFAKKWPQVLAALIAFDRAVTREQWQAWLEAGTGISVTAVDSSTPSQNLDLIARLYEAVQDPQKLAKLLQIQWQAFLKAQGSSLFDEKLPADLPERLYSLGVNFPLRQQLSIAALNDAWPTLRKLSSGAYQEAISKQLKLSVLLYFRNRLASGDTTTELYKNYYPRADADLAELATDRAIIEEKLGAYAEQFAQKHLIRTDSDYDKLQKIPTSEGMVIPLGDLVVASTGPKEDDAGREMRRTAGMGVLLRRSGSGEAGWRCLNLADIQLAPDSNSQSSSSPTIQNDALIPMRGCYRNGLSRPIVIYNNQPLVARSPVSQEWATPSSDHSEQALAIVQYTNCYGANRQSLVRLSFGEPYDLAVFRVGNAGDLTHELRAAPLDPWTWKLPDDSRRIPEGAVWEKIPHQRRVSICAVRPTVAEDLERFTAAGDAKDLELPAIPADVNPIGRSLLKSSAGLMPLLLLCPSQKGVWTDAVSPKFTFGVRPPATDICTWDQWYKPADRTQPDKDRSEVWGSYLRTAADAAQESKSRETNDRTLDDAAFAGFVCRLSRLDVDGNAIKQGPDRRVERLKGARKNAKIKPAQSPSLQITVLAKSDGKAGVERVSSDGVDITVTVVEAKPGDYGSVWRLEIFAAVAAGDAERLHPCILAEKSESASIDGKDYLLFSPLQIMVEVATAQLPAAEDLYHALKPRTSDISRGCAQVLFDKKKIQSWLWTLDSLDVLMQQWRWQGRPYGYVAELFLQTAGKALQDSSALDDNPEWDGALFGERAREDHRCIKTAIDRCPPIDDAPGLLKLFEQDFSNDTRLIYLRFALRAWSRYRGLLLRGFRDSRDGGTDGELWRRLVLPCRHRGQVPAPRLKLVVPLTAGAGDAKIASLLVVLDEPWYAYGGLAEELVIDIAQAQNSSGTRHEFGPDPIVDKGPPISSAAQVTVNAVRDYIGYTFDTDTQAPLFVRSSCIIDPPSVGDGRELSWYFLKLCVRRRLVDIQNPAASPMSSEMHGIWTQILPSSDHFLAHVPQQPATSIAVKNLRLKRLGEKLMLVNAANERVVLEPRKHAGSGRFSLCVLIIEQLFDAFGRQNQQRYNGLCRFAEDGFLVGDLQALPQGPRQLQARILEIQEHVSDPAAEAARIDSLTALFPPAASASAGENAADAKLRVVRVSSPIWESD